jgi:hypothetical protein
MADADADEEAELARQAEEDQRNPPVTIETLQRDMLAMERRHAEEIANLRRSSPPPRAADPPPRDTTEDLSQLLFTEPKKALQQLRQEVRQEVEASLTQKYNQDQNTQKFWTQFDTKYPDLAGDRDIVETILNKNLDTLANVPVEDAMEKLAELTRDRISRYTKAPRKRPFAEGASSPTPPRQPAEDEAPPSLSDIVRRRRAARQNRATVA